MMKKSDKNLSIKSPKITGYETILNDIAELLESARLASVRATNTFMTATYWEIGRRIVEFEQMGRKKAKYGETLIAQLSLDLTARFGRGFGPVNLSQMRKFYLVWPPDRIFQTVSEKSLPASYEDQKFQTLSEKLRTLSAQFTLKDIAQRFPLPWSHYVLLLSVKNPGARAFYEAEALRGGWSVRQLDRQILTQFYERTALSRKKAAMLKKGAKALPEDVVTPEEEIKDPFVLEFLGLKDEYSENDLEESLILQLENFLLELGGDFAFIGCQRRLSAQKDHAVTHYALEGLPNKVLAAEYRTALPDEETLVAEIEKTRRRLEGQGIIKPRD
jgi:predicted nuclease of restriction endonuclease-like (RecB) superfamily